MIIYFPNLSNIIIMWSHHLNLLLQICSQCSSVIIFNEILSDCTYSKHSIFPVYHNSELQFHSPYNHMFCLHNKPNSLTVLSLWLLSLSPSLHHFLSSSLHYLFPIIQSPSFPMIYHSPRDCNFSLIPVLAKIFKNMEPTITGSLFRQAT